MTQQEIFDNIIEWEQKAGESFFDYFCHDRVDNEQWAYYLLGKGFIERANTIIEIYDKSESGYVDQEDLYEVYPEHTNEFGVGWIEENYYKNLQLMSEFLSSVPYYNDLVTKWFKEKKY